MSTSKLFIFCLELSQKFAKNSSTVLKTSDVSTADGRSPHVKRLLHVKQDAQLSQRDRAAGHISFGRKWKTGTQRQ